MTIPEILQKVESTIKTQKEREYFLIHEARYKRILQEVQDMQDMKDMSDTKTRHARLAGQAFPAPLRVLDVGCFPYHIGAALELMGHEVWGIASAHEPIKNKKIAVINIETDKFPYKDNFFDLVIFSEVVEHLPHSPIPPLKEMHRVTRPDGHVLITTPNITRSINRGKILLGKSVMYSDEAYLENEGRGSNLYHRHNREYTMGELKKIMVNSSWFIEKAEYVIGYPPFRRRNRTDQPLLWLGKFANYLGMLAFPSLRDTLLVIGKK